MPDELDGHGVVELGIGQARNEQLGVEARVEVCRADVHAVAIVAAAFAGIDEAEDATVALDAVRQRISADRMVGRGLDVVGLPGQYVTSPKPVRSSMVSRAALARSSR